MKELHATLAKLLAIDEVPKGARIFLAIDSTSTDICWEFTDEFGLPDDNSGCVTLPPGQWQILGKGNEITPAQIRTIIPKVDDYYQVLEYGIVDFHATAAWTSLLTANGLTGEELILKLQKEEI